MVLRKAVSALMLMGAFTAASAEVCKHAPGSVTCGKGTVSSLSGNGMVTVNGLIEIICLEKLGTK